MSDGEENAVQPKQDTQISAEGFSFSVQQLSNCEVQYTANVQNDLVSRAREKAAKKLGRSLKVPGFRVGKAPLEVIEKSHHKQLESAWKEELAHIVYQQCAYMTNIPLAKQGARISFEVENMTNHSVTLVIRFDTLPKPPSIDPSQVKLHKEQVDEISKENIEETIRQVQFFFAEWTSVKDRPIKSGDYAILNIILTEKNPPKTLFKNTRFEITPNSTAEWLFDLIIGKHIGDVVEGISRVDQNLPEKEKGNFVPQKVSVEVVEIQVTELPPLTQDLLKKLGVSSENELFQRVKDILEGQRKKYIQKKMREQVLKHLLKIDFDIPATLVSEEFYMRRSNMLSSPEFLQAWQTWDQEKKKNFEEDMWKDSVTAIRIFCLCQKIAVDQNLSVTKEDREKKENMDFLTSLLAPEESQEEAENARFSRLLLEKTQDWIIDHAVIIDSVETVEEQPQEIVEEKSSKEPKKKASSKKAKPNQK